MSENSEMTQQGRAEGDARGALEGKLRQFTGLAEQASRLGGDGSEWLDNVADRIRECRREDTSELEEADVAELAQVVEGVGAILTHARTKLEDAVRQAEEIVARMEAKQKGKREVA